jgi:hypothetical protein
MSVSQDNSTTQPTGDFTNSMTDVTNLSNIVSKIPVVAEYAKPYADVIGLVNQFMGSMSETITQGATLTQNHSLGVMYQVQNSWTTGDLVGGPGLEDIFVFLKNAQLMWVARNGRLSVHLIKATLDMKAAHYLLENKDNLAGFDGLDSKTIKSMLALDPFTAPYVNFPYSPAMATPNGLMARSIPSRWVDLGQDDMGDSDVNPYSPTNSYTLSQADQTTQTNYSTDVFDAKAGILAALNPTGPDNPQNVTQTQTTKTTVSFGVSTAESSSQTSATSAKFYFAQNENLVAEAYYDVVFGTFAFVPQPSSPQATYTAVAVNAYGQPLAHQTVVLQIGGRKYVARTNAQGRYSFHSLNITPGSSGTLFAGGVSRQIQIGAPTARLFPGAIPVQRQPQ